MRRHTISQFMWGYQPHFRIMVQVLVRNALAAIGAPSEPEVLLVGVRRPDHENRHDVCVEPEDGDVPASVFDGAMERVKAIYAAHHLHGIFYGDEPSNREKPEVMRRDSVRQFVKSALKPYDLARGVESLCGGAFPVADFYVVPVVQAPKALLAQHPRLTPNTDTEQWQGYLSLIDAVIDVALREATQELGQPDPGKSHLQGRRSADEVIRVAAREFMYTLATATMSQHNYADLFERFNVVSSLLYEGSKGVGSLLLANPENSSLEYVIRFQDPVPLDTPRWARKVLQMAAADVAVIADGQWIYGLGRLATLHDASAQDVFKFNFLDLYHWEVKCGRQTLLRCRYGTPTLPQDVVGRDAFLSNYARLFPEASAAERTRIWELFDFLTTIGHGAMLVVAADAQSEAARLARQGTVVQPVALSEDLLERVSGIDGTILCDPRGYCHAIGVILDGAANDECTPSRGSRFNSGIRYVNANKGRRLAVVVSDDRTVDVYPMLRPRISRAELERTIGLLEHATLDNYHEPRTWLNSHRFYVGPEHCERINRAIAHLDALPKEVGEIYLTTNPFSPHPEMDDSYFLESGEPHAGTRP